MPQYNESMAVLYAALNIVWDSQAENETEFIAENTLYTPGLSVTRKAAIAAAQALPDGQARGTEAEVLRIGLTEKLDEVLAKWNSLDGYVSRAFTGEYYKPRIDEAGKPYYAKAANENWEYVSQLLVSMTNFLAAHGPVLVSNGGMPPGFDISVASVKTAFDALYSDFKDAQQDSYAQTDAKINANNAIYRDGRLMMEDGKRIFRKNAAVRDRFVWERVVELVTPSTGGSTVIREGDLAAGAIKNISWTGLAVSDDTMIRLEAQDSAMRFYSSSVEGGPQTGGAIDMAAGTVMEYTAAEFGEIMKFDEVNKYLNVQNVGATAGHWKMKATHIV